MIILTLPSPLDPNEMRDFALAFLATALQSSLMSAGDARSQASLPSTGHRSDRNSCESMKG